MLERIENNTLRLVNIVTAKYRSGAKVNILLMDTTSNISKVSLLYHLSNERFHFEVFVLTHDLSDVSLQLYENLNITLIKGGTLDKAVEENDIDILFLDNPHKYFSFVKPTYDFYSPISDSVFSRVLICYIPYAYISIRSDEPYTDMIHRFAWKFFIESHFHYLEAIGCRKNLEKRDNIFVTGHPFLDPYFSNEFDYIEKYDLRKLRTKTIVWCPHHNAAFYGNISLKEQEKFLRNLLEANPELIVVFRPHPNLLAVLNSKIHQESKDYRILIDQELSESIKGFWLQHPRVLYFSQGPIYQIFKTADVILHNCGSYQMEAVVSGTPVVNLVNLQLLNDHALQFKKFQHFPRNIGELSAITTQILDSGVGTTLRDKSADLGLDAGFQIAKNLDYTLSKC